MKSHSSGTIGTRNARVLGDDVPTYQYTCTACGHELEAVQSFTDEPLTDCPSCEGRLRKLFSGIGVVFKGSGFYRTDSRAAASSSPEKSSEKSSDKSPEKTSEKTPATTSEKPKSDSSSKSDTAKSTKTSTAA